MISALLLLLAAPGLAAAPKPAPAAIAPDVGVSTWVAAAEQRLMVRCARRPLDVESLLTDPGARRDLETVAPPEASALESYAACRELQGVKPGCAALEGLGQSFAGAPASCRAAEAHQRFVFLAVRGRDEAAAACRRMFEPEGKSGPPVERACAAVLDAVRAGDALAACPALRREKLIGPDENCEEHLASWSGRVESCARVKDANARRDCRERAALVAGLRTPARCADSPACRVLEAKSPGACDGLREAFSRTMCGRVAKSVDAEARREARLRERRGREESRLKEEARKAADAKARADAAVKAKAETEARALAAAQSKIAAQAAKPQYQKGQPMRRSGDIKEVMKKLEKGIPVPPEKPAPNAGEDSAPADGAPPPGN